MKQKLHQQISNKQIFILWNRTTSFLTGNVCNINYVVNIFIIIQYESIKEACAKQSNAR